MRICKQCGKDFIVPPDNSTAILSTNGGEGAKYGRKVGGSGPNGLPPRVKPNAVQHLGGAGGSSSFVGEQFTQLSISA